MPRNPDLKSILVIGSGPIVIGQACEFDYSGTQALKALREEGYRVILVNSNPATIMTDPEMADATYIEPVTPEYIEKIIEKERPCALIPTLGGQTSLNCAIALVKNQVLEKYDVQLIGASYEAITLAEDRTLFREKMLEIGLDIPKSKTIHTQQDVHDAVEELGLPLVVRSSFSLGGAGAEIVTTEAAALHAFESADYDELTFDEALIGWKEFELEVVRDKSDNCIVVCGVENFDPLGIHTGDSITVAPIQTLTDKEYQIMRDAAFKVLRAVGVDTGGSNVQFALHPKSGRMVVIEMNPRVSRSSALVSKATGFPIAKVAAKLAVGYTLNELRNGLLPAAFEPSIDYVVVKIPRFHDEKFNALMQHRGPAMRSVGEVMAIGSNFKESLQNAICSLETGSYGFDKTEPQGSTFLYSIAEAFRKGATIEEVHAQSHIDPWFLNQISEIIETERTSITRDSLPTLKKQGYSDHRIAELLQTTESEIRHLRKELGLIPVYKRVDSCAGEFSTPTNYFYSTYQQSCENNVSQKSKILIVGSGPNRIGQGIEFDYISVKAIQAFSKNGYETIMLNCNPETISTDFDVADKLYFVPLTFEKVMDVIEKEQPTAVALQFGGQTPLNLVDALSQAGVPLIGLDPEIIHLTEDRENFRELLMEFGLKQPRNIAVRDTKTAIDLQFPVIIRPSFVLGGVGMEVVSNPELLNIKLEALFAQSNHPVLVEEFLEGAIELDVDAISDGVDVFIPVFLEQIEAVGVHSGDSACITPHYKLTKSITNQIREQTTVLAKALKIIGIFNIQFAVKNGEIFVIEVNPRTSRTTPFICKATGLPLIEIAINCMLGKSLKAQKCLEPVKSPYYCVKEVVLPFKKFPHCQPLLGPEMKSTGEVMGIGRTPEMAYLKAQHAVGHRFQKGSDLIISYDGLAIPYAIANNLPYASTPEAAEFMQKSMNSMDMITVEPIQDIYKNIKHPSKTQHLLTGTELSAAQLKNILSLAKLLKQDPEKFATVLAGKRLAMIFEKPSFRTRLSFALAIQTLGGIAIESVSTTRKSEEPKDFARVLNGYCDIVMVRTHEDSNLSEMAEVSTIPIINGLSALYHPCQTLADLLTLQEYFGTLDQLTVSYIGDGNNILHSLLLMAPLLNMTIHYCCPPGHEPKSEILNQCDGRYVKSFSTPEEAVQGANAVYTDVWTSMGFEAERHEDHFKNYQVNEALMSQAKPGAIFMHCMPMERGKEVSTTLPDTPCSAIFDQSENRLHVQKALLLWFLNIH